MGADFRALPPPAAHSDAGQALVFANFLRQIAAPGLVGAGRLRPLQFPSLAHFDERVSATIERAVSIDGVRLTTRRWLLDGYKAFRRFLVASEMDTRFISGDFNQQRDVLTLWCAWLLKRGVGRVTIRTYWRALAALCSRLEAEDAMLNPFRWLRAPRTGRVLPKSITRENARTLLLFVQNYEWPTPFARIRNTAIVAIMLLAGLRRSEVAKLRREDVHERDGVIDIRGAKGRFGGKDRTAYMPPQLETILREYCEARSRRKPADPAFFLAIYRDRGIGGEAIKRLFETITAHVGFRVSPHRLRHTYATLLRQSGIADRVSMDLLGHEQLSTLQRYSRVFETEYKNEVQKLTLDLS